MILWMNVLVTEVGDMVLDMVSLTTILDNVTSACIVCHCFLHVCFLVRGIKLA